MEPLHNSTSNNGTQRPSSLRLGQRSTIINDIGRALQEWYSHITDKGITIRALGIGSALGIVLCPVNVFYGLKVGRPAPFMIPAIIATKALVPSLTQPEHFVATIVASTVSFIAMPAGLIGVIPALQYLVLPKEGEDARLQAGWFQLVLWAFALCLPGPLLATILRKPFLEYGRLPFTFAKTIASQIAACHGGTNSSTNPGTPEANSGEISCRDTTESELNHASPERQSHGWMALMRQLAGPVVLAVILVMTGECLLKFGIMAGVVGLGLIATSGVAVAMLLGALFRRLFLPTNVDGMGSLDEANTGQQNSKGAWVVLPALAGLLGELLTQAFIYVLSKLDVASKVGMKKAQPAALSDTDRSQTVNETSALQPDMAASGSYSGVRQLSQGILGPQGSDTFAEPTPSKGSPMSLLAIAAFALCLVGHIILLRISTGEMMPWEASIFSIIIAIIISLGSVQIFGQTNMNPVSALGKLSQICFVFLYPWDLSNPILTVLIVGAVTEAFACMAADLMMDYKIAGILGISPGVVLTAQLIGASIGSVCGPLWYVALNRLMGATSDGPPFQMPAAELWIAAARVAVKQEMSQEVALFSAAVAVAFVVIALLKSLTGLSWLPDGASFALGLYNNSIMTGWWAFGGLLRYGIVKVGGILWDQKVMLWGSGLMLGEGMTKLLLDLVPPLAAKCR